jgi:adenosylhomocysteinase
MAYFAHVIGELPTVTGVTAVCIAHMVSNSRHFLPAVNTIAPIGLVLPKPSSKSEEVLKEIQDRFNFKTYELSRDWARNAERVVETFHRHNLSKKRLVIIDIGGYFAPSISRIAHLFDGEICGVVEGTENGAQKYEGPGHFTDGVAILTVARSPLKLPEDHLVGASVVFSIEAVLRQEAQILQTRSACVIGFGRVGRGVAAALRGRGIPTVIHDNKDLPRAEAAAQGYRTFRRVEDALKNADLVVCATGNKALTAVGFDALEPGTVVATVTSRDDELDMEALLARFDAVKLSPSITMYSEPETRNHFWLINDGNAANFLHGAVIGPAIQLIEGEKLACISALANGEYPRDGELHELPTPQREVVARVWNTHFAPD